MTSLDHNWPGNRRTLFSGGFHRHFGGIKRTSDGVFHSVYRKATEHAITAGGSIVYVTTQGEGNGIVSAETVIASPASGRDLRDCAIGLTPTGRLVVFWTDRASSGTGTAYFYRIYSDDNGVTWSAPLAYVTNALNYCGNYGGMKVIPGGRLVKPGYRQIASVVIGGDLTSQYATCLYYSDDNGDTWAEGAPVYSGSGGYNETDVVFITDLIGFAAMRGSGLNWSVTTDGGLTWLSPVSMTWDASGHVAPSLEALVVDGVQYVVLSYCDRGTDKKTEIRWARAEALMANGEAFKYRRRDVPPADMVSASGYQSAVVYDSGEFILQDFREFAAPNTTTDVRLAYVNVGELISKTWTPTATSGSPVGVIDGTYKNNDGEVVARGRLLLSSKGGATGAVEFAGLPFTCEAGGQNRGSAVVSFLRYCSVGGKQITGYVFEGTDKVRFNVMGATTHTPLLWSDLADNSEIYFEARYPAVKPTL